MKDFAKEMTQLISWVNEDIEDDKDETGFSGGDPVEGLNAEIIKLADKYGIPSEAVAEYVYSADEQEQITVEQFYALYHLSDEEALKLYP